MTNVALVPESHVLQRNNRVTANDTRQTAQTLTRDRIAFMRHGGTAFLAFAKEFFHFEHFGTLEMPKFRSPTIDAGGNDGQCSHKFRMAIALHDLGRECRRFQSKLLANCALNLWINVRM